MSDPKTAEAAPSTLSLPLFVTSLLVAELGACFETSMIYAAIKKLLAAYGDPVNVGWLITIYLLIGAGMAAISGRLGDIYGRKRVMVVLLVLATIGSLISTFWHAYFPLMLFGRALQGLTVAVLPLCLGLARQYVPDRLLAVTVGGLISSASAGTLGGLVIGGLIIDNFPWPSVFLTSAILTLAGFLCVQFFVPSHHVSQSQPHPDWLGGVLFVPAIGCLLLGASKGGEWGWTSPVIIGLLVACAALLSVFVRISLRQSNPLFNLRLLAQREVMIANLGIAILALGTFQVAQVFSLMLQQPTWTIIGAGLSATVAGLVKMPSSICSMTAGPISGLISSRWGQSVNVILSAVIIILGWVLAIFFHDSVLQIGLWLCLMSLGSTMGYAAMPNIVTQAVAAERTSEATGMLVVVHSTAFAIGAQIVAVLMATDTVSEPSMASARFPSPQAYVLVMSYVAGISLLLVPLALFLPRSKTHHAEREKRITQN